MHSTLDLLLNKSRHFRPMFRECEKRWSWPPAAILLQLLSTEILSSNLLIRDVFVIQDDI
jgi:hypothetical protein